MEEQEDEVVEVGRVTKRMPGVRSLIGHGKVGVLGPGWGYGGLQLRDAFGRPAVKETLRPLAAEQPQQPPPCSGRAGGSGAGDWSGGEIAPDGGGGGDNSKGDTEELQRPSVSLIRAGSPCTSSFLLPRSDVIIQKNERSVTPERKYIYIFLCIDIDIYFFLKNTFPRSTVVSRQTIAVNSLAVRSAAGVELRAIPARRAEGELQ